MLRRFSLISAWIVCLFPLAGGYGQSDAYVLHRILQRYTESYGGFRDADALASLSVEGTIEQDGRTYAFLMHKKRPGLIRYRLADGMNSVVAGYNGSSCWLRTQTDGEVTIQDLDGDAATALRAQARFESPLFRHLEKSENEVSLVERTTKGGESVYVIEVREPGGRTGRYHLEARTAHLLRHDELDASGETTFQTLYRDYKEVEGFPFAHEVENRVADQTVSLAKVNTVEVNPGLLSFYFEKPRR
jgi:hypothetical protein